MADSSSNHARYGPGFSGLYDAGWREIKNNLYLIRKCIVKNAINDPSDGDMLDWYTPGRGIHNNRTAYLIDDDATLLYDTLSPRSTDDIVSHVDDILNGRELDYVVISHPEAPHAGNAHALLREYENATLVAAKKGSQHKLYGIDDDAMLVEDGDSLDLGSHTVTFLDPLFYDHAITIYMFDELTKSIFTADWMGYPHMASDCLKHAHELSNPVTADQFNRFNGYALFWLRFVDPDRTDAAIDQFLDRHQPEIVAPAHGQVIMDDAVGHIEKMKSVIREISEMGDDYHIHTHNEMRVNRR